MFILRRYPHQTLLPLSYHFLPLTAVSFFNLQKNRWFEMEQEFKFVAPRAKLTRMGIHTMAGMLFGPSISYFPKFLIVPIRPQRNIALQLQTERSVPRTFMVDGAKRITKGQQGKYNSNNKINADSSQYHNQTKPHAIVNIFCLPLEIHRIMFSFIGDIINVVSFGLTNPYFWSVCHEYIDNYNLPNN